MNYRETLFFVAQCLTINTERENKESVLIKLKNEKIDWDMVVKLSTAHYIFPALYYNLKKTRLLKYVPDELVSHMKYISELNLERNKQIIVQVVELNKILKSNNIKPIFLKGTGNLVDNLYNNIGERMIGDIDFICSKNDYPKAIKTLTKNGYFPVDKTKYSYPEFKHYRRLKNKKGIAAVEIHKELIIEGYHEEFNYDLVIKNVRKSKGINILSFEDQLVLSIVTNQINDNGFYYKTVPLRNAYDVFLLSKKTNAKDYFSKFENLKKILNCFLAVCHTIFGNIKTLEYNKTKETENYLSLINSFFLDERRRKRRMKSIYILLYIRKRLSILFRSLFDEEYREWVLNRILDKKWQRKKMIQLGLKKNK